MLFEKAKTLARNPWQEVLRHRDRFHELLFPNPDDLQVEAGEETKWKYKKRLKKNTLESLQGQLLTQTVNEGEDREEGGFNVWNNCCTQTHTNTHLSAPKCSDVNTNPERTNSTSMK